MLQKGFTGRAERHSSWYLRWRPAWHETDFGRDGVSRALHPGDPRPNGCSPPTIALFWMGFSGNCGPDRLGATCLRGSAGGSRSTASSGAGRGWAAEGILEALNANGQVSDAIQMIDIEPVHATGSREPARVVRAHDRATALKGRSHDAPPVQAPWRRRQDLGRSRPSVGTRSAGWFSDRPSTS